MSLVKETNRKRKTKQKKMPRPWRREDSGIWYVQIGSRQINLGRDEEAAYEQYHELMSNKEDVAPGKYVLDLLDEYLVWCKKHRSEATYDWYDYFIHSFCRTIKKKLTLSQLKPLHVTAWVDKAFSDSSDATKRGAITALQRAFNWAVKQGWIRRSPLFGIEKPAETKREVVLSTEQYEAIHEKALDRPFKDLLTILWETGCRPQEAVRVEARHFQPELRRWVFSKEESKGKKHERVVYLNDAAFELTKKLCEHYPEGKLFRNSKGKPWNKNSVRCRFRNMDHGIEGLCAYNVRHTWCNRALKNGVNSLTVALLMGHVDISMIARNYAHQSQDPDFLQEQMRRATVATDARPTPIAAKPSANTFSATNYQALPRPGRYREKSSNSPKASWHWPPNVARFSESAEP